MSSALSSPLAVELSFFTVSQSHNGKNEQGKRTQRKEKPAILLIDYPVTRGKYIFKCCHLFCRFFSILL